MKLSRLLVLAALVTSTACARASGNYFAPTAAVVCGRDVECVNIPESRIGQFLTQVVKNPATASQFHGPQGAVNRRDAKRLVLNGLIREAVARQHAEKMGIRVTPSEITRRFNTIRNRFQTEAQFLSSLRAENFSPADLRIYLGNQMLYEEVAERLAKDKQPTDGELRAYYEQNRVGSYDTQISVAHILICGTFDQSTRLCEATENDRTLATEVANQARSGADFSALAKQFSKDPSNADKGGELGYVNPGQLAADFERVAFALTQVGQISDPVETPFGYHVIKLLAKGKSFEAARPEILASLKQEREREAFNTWIEDNIESATVRVNPKFGRFDRASQTVVPLKVQIPPAAQGGQSGGATRPPQPPQAPQAPQQAPQAPREPPAAPAPPAPPAP